MERFGAVLEKARAVRRLPAPAIRRILRVRAGLSQQDIADAIGVSRVAVTLWESGARNPNDENLRAYLQLLDRLASEIR